MRALTFLTFTQTICVSCPVSGRDKNCKLGHVQNCAVHWVNPWVAPAPSKVQAQRSATPHILQGWFDRNRFWQYWNIGLNGLIILVNWENKVRLYAASGSTTTVIWISNTINFPFRVRLMRPLSEFRDSQKRIICRFFKTRASAAHR